MTRTSGVTDAPDDAPSRSGLGAKELLVMISSIMALTAMGIDLLLPAFDEIRDAFNLAEDSNQVSQVITVFFLGLAVAQIVWGPLTDRFGRKKILYSSIAVYALGAVMSALAPSFLWLLIGRFVWGVGAAGTRVVAIAIVRDSFEGSKMAQAMSQIMAVFVLVPVFAPSLGAILISIFNWQSLFWFCVIWSGAIMLWTSRLNETLRPEHRRELEVSSIVAGFKVVVSNRMTFGYTIATLFLQAIFTAYLASSEHIISDIFDRGDQFPVIFGAVAILFGVGAIINGQVVGRFGMYRLIRVMLMAAMGMGLLLLAVAVFSDGRPSFWIYMPLLGVMLAMFMFLMPNLNTAALEPMGAVAGTATSLTGAIRTAGGALLGAVVDAQLSDSVLPFSIAIVIFMALAIIASRWAERGQHVPGHSPQDLQPAA